MIALFDRLDGVDAAKVDASLLMPKLRFVESMPPSWCRTALRGSAAAFAACLIDNYLVCATGPHLRAH
jgi:hypothetical protein